MGKLICAKCRDWVYAINTVTVQEVSPHDQILHNDKRVKKFNRDFIRFCEAVNGNEIMFDGRHKCICENKFFEGCLEGSRANVSDG